MALPLHPLAVVGVAVALATSLAAVPENRSVDAVTPPASADARPLRAPDSAPPADRGPVDAAAAVRTAAIAAVEADDGVPLADGGTCDRADLYVAYADPGTGWTSGAWLGTLGPEPTAATTAVNGIVRCVGSRHAFVGFEAVEDDGRWTVGLVPDPHLGSAPVGEARDAAGLGNEPDRDAPEQPGPGPRTAPAPSGTPAALVGRAGGPAIEGYARYEAQTTCSPTAKPGTVALRDVLLRTYPGSRSLGIVRGCAVGGRSEHKEGRAFDWGVLASRPAERAAADDFVARLTATDAYGNRHALARRMGVMYVIWNRRIWSPYNANAGWRAYNGSNPHTDHVHISLSWAGARGETSFWTGQVVEGLSAVPVGGGSGGGTTTSADPAPSDEREAPRPDREERWREERWREDRDLSEGGDPGEDREAERATAVARWQAEQAERAARDAEKARERAAREAEKAREEAAKEAEKAREEAAKAREEAAKEAEKAARDAERRPHGDAVASASTATSAPARDRGRDADVRKPRTEKDGGDARGGRGGGKAGGRKGGGKGEGGGKGD